MIGVFSYRDIMIKLIIRIIEVRQNISRVEFFKLINYNSYLVFGLVI